MRKVKTLLYRLFHPPGWALAPLSAGAFTALIILFAVGETEGALAYLIYGMSAYALAALLLLWPRMAAWWKTKKAYLLHSSRLGQSLSSSLGARYLRDSSFRGGVGIYQGVIVNLLYMVFRIVAGVRYASVWFVSMAVYYMVLGGMRAYLLWGYRRRKRGYGFECRCYRRTAGLLFLLNIPMGGMIWLMVRTDLAFLYPGYVIYLSALYTFCAWITSFVHLIRFRRMESPILSAAKVLNFVAATMSILGLQTAMIDRFSSNGEAYRRMMNAITGGCVYGAVIILAVYMRIHVSKLEKKVSKLE